MFCSSYGAVIYLTVADKNGVDIGIGEPVLVAESGNIYLGADDGMTINRVSSDHTDSDNYTGIDGTVYLNDIIGTGNDLQFGRVISNAVSADTTDMRDYISINNYGGQTGTAYVAPFDLAIGASELEPQTFMGIKLTSNFEKDGNDINISVELTGTTTNYDNYELIATDSYIIENGNDGNSLTYAEKIGVANFYDDFLSANAPNFSQIYEQRAGIIDEFINSDDLTYSVAQTAFNYKLESEEYGNTSWYSERSFERAYYNIGLTGNNGNTGLHTIPGNINGMRIYSKDAISYGW
jgi:hypothetical protein